MSDSAWLKHSVDRTIPASFNFTGFAPVVWDTVEYATDGMYDPGNPERLTCVNDGVHVVLAQASWHKSAPGDYGIAIRKNSNLFRAETQPGSTGKFWPAMQCVAIHRCVAGDYFNVEVGQQTSSSQILGADGTWFSVVRVPEPGEMGGGGGGGFTEDQIRAMIRDEIAAASLVPRGAV